MKRRWVSYQPRNIDHHSGVFKNQRARTHLATRLDPYLSMPATDDFGPKGDLECVGRVGRRGHGGLAVGEAADAEGRRALDGVADDGLEGERAQALHVRDEADSVHGAWRGARVLMCLYVATIIPCITSARGGRVGAVDGVGGGHGGGSERCGSLVVVVARMAHVQPRCPTTVIHTIPSVVRGCTARAPSEHIGEGLPGAQRR